MDGSSKAICAYLDSSGRDDVLTGGVKLIPVDTPKGQFRVWTKRVGNHPTRKVLLLHGGPGATHESFEACDSYFPAAGIEYYYYDQLGSYYSDQPDDPDLWETERFVEEVEQVRRALRLDADNFYLLGVSWGGIRAIEYALKSQQHQRTLKHLNPEVHVPMQGPSELGASGKLLNCDRTGDLPRIAVPSLMIGARYDTMDPAHLERMASAVQHGRFHYCPNGSHLAMYDNQQAYFAGLIEFIHDVDAGCFA